MKLLIVILALAALLGSGVSQAEELSYTFREDNDRAISAWLESNLPDLVKTYKHLHRHPELSLAEHKTAELLSTELSRCGFEVTSGVGGTGVVGVLKNGAGRTILIRTDMDALPVIEETGLDYASEVRVEREDGSHVGVMHACGHDVHMTMFVGTARLLQQMRERWSGTVVMIAQPAEELGRGARMMIDDGLFERIPKPDLCLALHVQHNLPATQVSYTSGWAFANVDSVDITIHGRGGHGARPDLSIDPIVAAAHVITSLQTIVSRRVDPMEQAVITVGSIHGGSKHNIIPNEVKLQLTVRSYTEEVRKQLLDGIKQITIATCKALGCPKAPEVVFLDEHVPASFNDPQLTAAAVDVFKRVFGEENVIEQKGEMGAEDFSRYARFLKVPGLQFRVGTISRQLYEASLLPGAASLPSIHSSKFVPLPEESVRTSVRAMSNLALALLAKN